MRHTPRALALLLPALLFCALSAAEARADALVVTGGFGTSNGVFGGPFLLTGEGFVLSGSTLQGSASFPALAGALVNLGSNNVGLDISSGGFYNGFLRFDAPFVVPGVALDLFVVTTPFTFTGRIQVCEDPLASVNGCPAGRISFEADLTGSGIATAVLTSFELSPGGPRVYSLRSVRYDFAAPTPEPATLVLLASGLAGVGAAARRRRRKAVSREP